METREGEAAREAGFEHEPGAEPRGGAERAPGGGRGGAAERAPGGERGGAPPRGGLEDFLGGRVLAWAGSAIVLLGVVLLVAVAIGRGWIDEPTRIAIAFAVSACLLAAGAWLYERRGKTQAAMLTAGTGLSGLFLTFAAGVQLYHLY